jgi:hypothetical protein
MLFAIIYNGSTFGIEKIPRCRFLKKCLYCLQYKTAWEK